MVNENAALAPTFATKYVALLQPLDDDAQYFGNPLRIAADEASCERAFVLAFRLERLFFIHPEGIELVGRLLSLPANTNHHLVCRWVMQSMPYLCARPADGIEVAQMINRFARDLGAISQRRSS